MRASLASTRPSAARLGTRRNNVEIGFGLSPGFDHTNRANVASSLSPFVSIMRPLFLKKLKHAAKQSDSALQSSYLAVATLQISA